MSNSLMTTSKVLRDEEELEGTLLPVATHIDENSSSAATEAVPLVTFDYDTAIVEEQLQQQEEKIAYSIPQSTNEKSAVADDSRSIVKLAQHVGQIEAEAEKEAIQKANREAFAKDYHTREAIRAANYIAKQRDHTGLEMEPIEIVDSNEKKTTNRASRSNDQAEFKKGGYEVKEYAFGSDYETSEYQVSDYKSVYD